MDYDELTDGYCSNPAPTTHLLGRGQSTHGTGLVMRVTAAAVLDTRSCRRASCFPVTIASNLAAVKL